MKSLIVIFFALLCAQFALAEKMKSLQDIPLNDINGKPTSLKAYDGKVVLLVNVASHCGYTPQYQGLQKIYEKYQDKGFVLVGVPCNDFGAQEPGSADEIKTFCSSKYHVTFPLMEKVHVKGPEQHPLYAALTGKQSAFPGDVKWNFGKFLIGRDGKLIKRFDSKVTPESPELTQAIEAALSKK